MFPISLPIGVALSLLPAAPPASPAFQEEAEPTLADEAPASEDAEGGWSFSVRPYVWAASVDGSIGVKNLGSVDVDLGFDDILEDLDFAWMVQLEARTPDDRWGLLLDTLYFDLSGQVGPAEWDIEQKMVELDAAWRVAEGVELIAGARYVDIDTAAAAPSLGVGFARSDDWVDPVVGVRGHYELGERWSLRGRGDIGGFGVGSDFSWQLAGYVVFHASQRFDIGLGYRHLDIERDKDNLDFDIALSGPLLGIGFQF